MAHIEGCLYCTVLHAVRWTRFFFPPLRLDECIALKADVSRKIQSSRLHDGPEGKSLLIFKKYLHIHP
jgi:hypothetical protein